MHLEGRFLVQPIEEYIDDESSGIAEKYRDLVIDENEQYALNELKSDYRHFEKIDSEIVGLLFTAVAYKIGKKLSDIIN
jgi:hypothetical protein